ncbi:MAG: tail fiber domain-containing protein [Proteobacteria bacterium]|nr:tail fiber domain-containing protein [Pseudomonadota bacterium]
MEDKKSVEAAEARRDFLKTAGKIAVAAPAAALLLSAGAKPAKAQVQYGQPIPSDIRLKTDIERIGTTVMGLPLYTFRYKGENGLYSGVMAQDVLEVAPTAVSVGSDGFYRVHYDRLGIEMTQLH